MPALTVALDGQTTLIPVDDEIDSISTHWPLRPHAVAGGQKPGQYTLFKLRLRLSALFLHRTQ